jgi:hypothetical protein
MSMIGGRRVNQKGRSTGQFKVRRGLKIGSQFVPHTIDMLQSPAWRVLSQSARRVLDRIEIEHMAHGGSENGRLPVTFDDFERYGVHRHSIAPAIRECEALGFAEITQRGIAGNAEFRSPHHYRLTYMPAMAREPATHEWRKTETTREAETLARTARNTKREKQNPSGGKRTNTSGGKRTTNTEFYSAETTTTGPVRKPPLLSISPVGRLPWTTPTVTEMSWSEYLASLPDSIKMLAG